MPCIIAEIFGLLAFEHALSEAVDPGFSALYVQ